MNQTQREKRRKDRSCSMLKQMRMAKLSQIGFGYFSCNLWDDRKEKCPLFTKNTSGWKPVVSHACEFDWEAWTTSRMRKMGSSRPWLFHIFQLCALISPLLVGEFFSNFWWQLRSIGCVHIPIFKKSVGGKKIRKVRFFVSFICPTEFF